MYDEILFQERMAQRGLNFYRLGKKAGVDPKTAKNVVETGSGNPDKVFLVAKALGFDVKKRGDEYDLTAIMKRRRSA